MRIDGGAGGFDDLAEQARRLDNADGNETDGSAGGSAARIMATRTSLLRAAREVFALRGYHHATVTEIVRRSGTSTGSLYNRFGGKENLYLELHRQYFLGMWESARTAMDQERLDSAASDGVPDPIRGFLAGARVLLVQSWVGRDLVALFLSSGPPGFDAFSIDGERRWVDETAELLRIADHPRGWELASAITAVIVAGATRVVRATDSDDAAGIADFYVDLVARLAESDMAMLDAAP